MKRGAKELPAKLREIHPERLRQQQTVYRAKPTTLMATFAMTMNSEQSGRETWTATTARRINKSADCRTHKRGESKYLQTAKTRRVQSDWFIASLRSARNSWRWYTAATPEIVPDW